MSGWKHTTYFYNSAEFGDPMVSHRVCIKIFRILDTDYNLDCEYPPTLSRPREYGYCHCLRTELNNPADLYSLELSSGILELTSESPIPASLLPYTIATTPVQNKTRVSCIILHPSYLGREPSTFGGRVSHPNVVGNLFGVPFHDTNVTIYGCLLSGVELLLCYLAQKDIIPTRVLFPSVDSILDALLPRCLPF